MIVGLGLEYCSQERENERRLALGREALKRGNWQLAIDHSDDVLVFQPGHPQALVYRGLAYYRLDTGNVGWALEDYNQAIEEEPDFTEAYVNRGVLYLEQGLYDRAIEDFDKVIKLNPDYALAYNNRGLAYAQKDTYDRAIDDCDTFGCLYPTNHIFVSAYAQKDAYDRAIQDFSQAITLKPDFAEAYNNRGLAYALQGAYGRAIEDFSQAIKLNPGDALAYYNRGYAYVQKGDYDQALLDLDAVIRLKPDSDLGRLVQPLREQVIQAKAQQQGC